MDTLILDSRQETLVLSKKGQHNQFFFALMIKFFELNGRHLTRNDYVPHDLLLSIGDQLGIDRQNLDHFDWNGITIKRFRRDIRNLFGYRKAAKKDKDLLIGWVIKEGAPQGLDLSRLLDNSYVFFRDQKIEPFSPRKMEEYIRTGLTRFEEHFFLTVSKSILDDTKVQLDDLLKREGSDEETLITFDSLKKDCMSAKESPFAIQKLEFLRGLHLSKEVYQTVSKKLLHKYYLRVLSQFSSHMEEYKKQNFYSHLAIFCHLRSERLTDNLAGLLIQGIVKLRSSSETHVVKTAVLEIKKVNGKFDILYQLASISVEHPQGIIKEEIYPKISHQTLKDLQEELQCHKGRWYEEQVAKKMRSLYSHGRRKTLFPLLEVLEFKTTTQEGKDLLLVIEFIKAHKDDLYYPKDFPEFFNIKRTGKSEGTINKYDYELSVFEELSRQLNCKIVWIEGSCRYRDPNEDMPKDFDQHAEHYYKMLDFPCDPEEFTNILQAKHEEALKVLDDSILQNDKVKIIEGKKGGRLKVSPSKAQAKPTHLSALQQSVKRRWASISLLDVLKETDRRVNFTECLGTIGTRGTTDSLKLKKRLLLCLYGIGSNTGLTRVSVANDDTPYDDLKYTKSRHLHKENVKASTVKIINDMIRIRDPEIWGEGTTGVACDSTLVGSWDQNLMTEWHPRYKDCGVMIYWHVDLKAMVVHSGMKTCLSSEVGSMLQGFLHHDTTMNMNEVYVDTHGQSVIGFGLSYLLHFDLLPRLRGIHRQKLYGSKKEYKNIKKILKGLINWKLIQENYHEVIRVAAALKTGTVDPEGIIKRFSKDNYDHPVYRALNEIGKAVKSIFLCRYLSSEKLRIEIHEALNVVERMNSTMDFLFYGKLGEISTNNKEAQELTIACLHLLQVAMVYINTLLIQETLKTWKGKLTIEDKRALTPLIHSHLNPYGLFPLNMNEKLTIEGIGEMLEKRMKPFKKKAS